MARERLRLSDSLIFTRGRWLLHHVDRLSYLVDLVHGRCFSSDGPLFDRPDRTISFTISVSGFQYSGNDEKKVSILIPPRNSAARVEVGRPHQPISVAYPPATRRSRSYPHGPSARRARTPSPIVHHLASICLTRTQELFPQRPKFESSPAASRIPGWQRLRLR